jgi:1,2-beta-oligoglucan phosphorylase
MTPTGLVRVASPSGLTVQFNANASIRRIDCSDVMLNTFLGNELEGGPANLVLRRRAQRITWTPLLGPRSPGAVHLDETGLEVRGEWENLRFHVSLRLADAAPAWFWHVQLENIGTVAAAFDLLHVQDVALADYGTVRLNEYYASQYVDYSPLAHPSRGVVLAIRQNLSIGGRHPWALIGSLSRGTHFATDALSYYGLAARATGVPEALEAESLPSERCQREHSLAVIQDEAVSLSPGAHAARGFFGWLELDHPAASSQSDLSLVERALALPEAKPPPQPAASRAAASSPAATLFSARPMLATRELDPAQIDAMFGAERREVEYAGDRALSFFHGADAHVVLPAKERVSLRSHGQILRTGDALTPDEASLTSTVWIGGVFHSMVTQGHVSINRLLSTTHGYLGLFRSYGQRIFVELEDGYALLDAPSAFEMTPRSARWIYRTASGLFQVRSWAAVAHHELWLRVDVLEGPPRRFLLSNHLAVNGDDGAEAVPARVSRDAHGFAVGLLPDTDLGRRFPDGSFRFDPAHGTEFEQVGGDELLFEDGSSRGLPFIVFVTRATRSLGLRMTGRLLGDPPRGSERDASAEDDGEAAKRYWSRMTGPLDLHRASGPAQTAVAPLAEILPWFAHDALIHYLAPRGLDQYSGGGWGTRDVCQGPVELLLALGRTEPVRDLLLRVFRNQNPDGDWPQWFMFFERERAIRPGDSHGDIVFWPLLALAQYLLASGDTGLLDETAPFFHPEGDARAEHATVLAHVERALGLIARRVIPGTRLAAYGHGDWNDSLQPADPALAERLCSAWTVTLHHQTLVTLAAALRRAGRRSIADELEEQLPRIRDDFQRLLVADGVVAGLALFRGDGQIEHWLHPRDRTTGVGYSLLPMIHAILAGLFTHEQAQHHVDVIRRHLLASDGARLFDRPFLYRGGVQQQFQRAETGTFFGREIGLMYTHAHLRYAEAMAHLGEAEAFFTALRQVNPVGLRAVVPNARPRQVNCYTSSSDAVFPDRYQAAARYDEVNTGAIAVEGGWRVYSSGAGIAVHLVRECLLGLRLGHAELRIDPVLPRALDGLRATVEIAGQPVELRYRIGERGFGPKALALNGADLAFERTDNPYREGGARIAMAELRERLGASSNTLLIELG